MSQKKTKDPVPGVIGTGSMKTDSLGESVEVHPTTPPAGQQDRTQQDGYVALPSEAVLRRWPGKWVDLRPMSWSEALHWLETYNNWATVWGKDFTFAPYWEDAYWIYGPELNLSRSSLTFGIRSDRSINMGWPYDELFCYSGPMERIGTIRLLRWRPFLGLWNGYRVPAKPEKVLWAGWFYPFGGGGK